MRAHVLRCVAALLLAAPVMAGEESASAASASAAAPWAWRPSSIAVVRPAGEIGDRTTVESSFGSSKA